MDDLIPISKINDFIFCPYSLYLHLNYEHLSSAVYHESPQNIGKITHEPIDNGVYSSAKKFLQGIEVSSQKYCLTGKIDIFDKEAGILVERKYKIKKIYDGYKYQLYAQYLCLKEMGYRVKSIKLHSLSDNKRYSLSLPDKKEMEKFLDVLEQIKNFKPENFKTKTNINKCENCIYNPLC